MMDDTRRLDWLEETHHVICYQRDGDWDSGYWFCVDREFEEYSPEYKGIIKGWRERPEDEDLRTAIDAAIKEVEGE
jgi:hypothetical protein